MSPSSRGPDSLPRHLHATLSAHKGPVNVARYAKGAGKYILTGGQDRTVKLWNASSGSEVKTFAAHGYEVLSVTVSAFCSVLFRIVLTLYFRSHDNAQFASCGGDRSVFVWDVATAVTTRRLAGHMGKIHVVEFNEDATVLASGILLNLFRMSRRLKLLHRIFRLHRSSVGSQVLDNLKSIV